MWAATSGRKALRQFLISTWSQRRSQRKSVLLCSFNCVSVCDAVTQAGFSPETFDLADISGRIDWDSLAARLRDDHHAVVIPHFFGVPTDFRPIRKAAAELGIFLVEDCAHTLGGKIGGTLAGTLGDAAFFSFQYDKPISLGGGGVLLINNTELEALFQCSHEEVPAGLERGEIKLFVGYLQERRGMIRPPTRFCRLRRRYMPASRASQALMPASGIGSLRAALGIWQLDRYAKICDERNRNAKRFSAIPEWQAWHVSTEVSPAWLKQKIIPVQPIDVQPISQRLHKRGLRVGTFNWPTTLDRVLSRPERPNALHVATYGLDVPIHQAMDRKELELIRDTLDDSTTACSHTASKHP